MHRVHAVYPVKGPGPGAAGMAGAQLNVESPVASGHNIVVLQQAIDEARRKYPENAVPSLLVLGPLAAA